MDIITAIETRAGKFSKGQRRIVDFITKNYEKAAFMTASRLAQFTEVSESTVVRFAAELGYNGYPEMRRAIQDMIRNRLTSVQRIQVAKDTINTSDILSHVLSADIDQIRLTMEELDRDDFDLAVHKIAGAKNIYILGMRSSSVLANIMGYYFSLIFNNVRVLNENPFEQLIKLSKDDVLVALSFPRYSQRTVKAMSYAHDVGASTIAITDSKLSPLVEFADLTLLARSDMVSFLDTLVAPLSLVNALIVAVSEQAPGDLHANFERLERVWEDYGVYEKLDE